MSCWVLTYFSASPGARLVYASQVIERRSRLRLWFVWCGSAKVGFAGVPGGDHGPPRQCLVDHRDVKRYTNVVHGSHSQAVALDRSHVMTIDGFDAAHSNVRQCDSSTHTYNTAYAPQPRPTRQGLILISPCFPHDARALPVGTARHDDAHMRRITRLDNEIGPMPFRRQQQTGPNPSSTVHQTFFARHLDRITHTTRPCDRTASR